MSESAHGASVLCSRAGRLAEGHCRGQIHGGRPSHFWALPSTRSAPPQRQHRRGPSFPQGRDAHTGAVETRGRKRVLSSAGVLAMDKARKQLIKDTDGTKRRIWELVRSKARAPREDATAVTLAFVRESSRRQASPLPREASLCALWTRSAI